ncbi:Nucleolar protein 4-like protein [Leptotrombidium deliense]|uniref:Nucleolar protein 4-like protein n=1 Tax=Leptotrombidium deliense TaxID=299467 RepID=A0A443SQQ0_9ACAR|nr:Nucleolar protein 4-like protein [Leptotrombidium deliense]
MSSNDDAANNTSNTIKPLKIGIKRDSAAVTRSQKSVRAATENALSLVADSHTTAENCSQLTGNHDPMYEHYQEWVSKTYGDSAKTKTVTLRKYNRIAKILKGEESTSIENSKFRFWVKAKGFKLGPLIDEDGKECSEEVLYVPCTKNAFGLIFLFSEILDCLRVTFLLRLISEIVKTE